MRSILKRPLITEKTLALAGRGWYTFVVDSDAAKHHIAEAINSYYAVNVCDVRTQMRHGKTRRVGKRMKTVQKSDWKKALVRLKEGQTIPAFEITQEEGEKGKK